MADFHRYKPLLERLGCDPSLIRHCRVVFEMAILIARLLKERGVSIDLSLVAEGAALHDIGRTRTHSVRHGVEGGKLGRELGLSERVVSIIERHVGAGIPLDEARKIGLPPRDYSPVSWEEKVVCYADKLVKGERYTGLGVALLDLAKVLGPSHPALRRLCKLHKEIWKAVGAWPKWA